MKASCLGVNVVTWMRGMTYAVPELIGCARMLSRSNLRRPAWIRRHVPGELLYPDPGLQSQPFLDAPAANDAIGLLAPIG